MSRYGLVMLGLALACPPPALAQPAGPDAGPWWGWALPRVSEGAEARSIAASRGSKTSREHKHTRRAGFYDIGPPAFCRTGDGHPELGWEWCVDRGYAHGWTPKEWTGVEFRGDTEPAARPLTNGGLRALLGAEVYRRLRQAAWDRGLDAPLRGRWLDVGEAEGATALQLVAGAHPLAELTDLDGDRKVDAVLLMSPDWE